MTMVVGVIVLIIAAATSAALVMRCQVNAFALILRTLISLFRLALCAAFCWLMLRAEQRIR